MHAALHQLYFARKDSTALRIESGHGNPMWTLLYYPIDPPAVAYGEGLPLAWIDRRSGLAVFRNRYQDSNDILFAVYAKSFHGGGHEQFDAGSFRFLGLGSSWAHAGGQAKPEAIYQNVLLRNGKQVDQKRERAPRTGKVIYFAPQEQGGMVSVDVSHVYGTGRVRRHFAIAFDPLPGVAAVAAIWDEIADRDQPASAWQWSLCYEPSLELALDPNARRFQLLRSAPSASLHAHFGTPAALELQAGHGPPTERTFSEGRRQAYPGARYLTAATRDDDPGFCTVLTLQDGAPPAVRFEGSGTACTAIVAESLRIRLDRSKWFQGPLRIAPLADGPATSHVQGDLQSAR